ncbi:MAG: hypothetical protein COB76_05485 [Alphaproteobacteria bacterium]|nr:MAG: hypothetical protein COB76_05485 [Alphaproteobacteria bacterium]
MSVETLFLAAIVLLAMELVVVSMGSLGFLGFLAFLYGLFTMHESGMDNLYGVSFATIAGLGSSIFIIFSIGGYFAFKAFGKKIETGTEAMMGKLVTVTQWSGKKGKVVFEGEDWRAKSTDTISKGDIVAITAYKNLTLTVKKET